VAMLSLPLSAVAFAPAGAPARAPAMAQPAVSMATEMSQAVPFLKRPPALDGSMAGDRGFDPLGFSTTVTELGGDLNYVREAELMHGRQSMLAMVGFVFPSIFGKIPVDWAADVSTNPLIAQYQLPDQIYAQLFVSMAIAEGVRAKYVYSDSAPGEHGFDPMGFIPKFCDTPEKMMLMKEKEISHCRAAMIGITGFFFQLAVKGDIYPLM